jgi:hypothetical protein
MAINDPNPFVGAYSKPTAKKKKMIGLSGPEDVVAGKGFLANGLFDLELYNTPKSHISGVRVDNTPSSEEVIGRPDAQNTAQRSKSVASGMKDAYDAVAKAKDLIPKTPQEEMSAFDKQKQDTFKKYGSIGRNPFSGEKAMAFDAASGKRELTPKLQEIVNANFAEFQAVSEILDRKNNPSKYAKMGEMDMGMGGRELMKWGGGGAGKKQSSSTANVAMSGEQERGLTANEMEQRAKEGTLAGVYSSTYDQLRSNLGLNIANPTRRY